MLIITLESFICSIYYAASLAGCI